MADIKIERCKRDDFPPMVRIWEQWCDEMGKKNAAFPIKKGTNYMFQEYLNQIYLDVKYVIYVAQKDGDVAGFCIGLVETRPPVYLYAKVGHIESLCIPTAPGSEEIKRELFNTLADWCKEKGAKVLEVSIYDTGAEMLSSWSKLGFKFIKAICHRPV